MRKEETERIFTTLNCNNSRNKYYVYALCNGKIPFYIGKGSGWRILQHGRDADEFLDIVDDPDELPENTREKIKQIIENKDNLECVIIKWGLTENEAFACESALINLLDYAHNVNFSSLTNIVNGHATDAEKMSVADIKTKARTMEQFLNECAIPEIDISEIPGNDVIFIKINQLYNLCIESDGSADERKVGDAVRAMWRISANRKNSIKYIFALYRQRVVGIFKVLRASEPIGIEYQKNGMKDFPLFPAEAREMDLWKGKFASLDEAEQNLNRDDFARFKEKITIEAANKNKNIDALLKLERKRIFFTIEYGDENIPDELKKFMNCIIIDSKNPEFFKSQSPVQYKRQ